MSMDAQSRTPAGNKKNRANLTTATQSTDDSVWEKRCLEKPASFAHDNILLHYVELPGWILWTAISVKYFKSLIRESVIYFVHGYVYWEEEINISKAKLIFHKKP